MSEPALTAVEKPSRYAGGEWNAVLKDPAAVRFRIALAFPDLYEIGMSYLGQKILYQRANARADMQAERVFAPWPDFEKALRASGEPLRSLESQTPLREFDILAFSLLYELNDSNILTILDLGGIPLRASERRPDDPLVLAGGPAAFNPEPLAGTMEAFFLGDGEEGLLEISDAWAASAKSGAGRAERLAALAGIPGVYVPSLYDAYQPGSSPLLAVRPARAGVPPVVRKRVLDTFRTSEFPENIVVPNLQAVFDRVAVEVARGCPQKCRFCQATSLYAPYRVKDPVCVVDAALNSVAATGYEDTSLFGLSVGDYPHLEPVVERLMSSLAPQRVSLSLSSMRPKRLSAELVETITKVRKTGFTLVPEAGTERLRRVINKPVEDKDLWEAADHAFRRGWRLLKLYFMIGLPTETDADVEAIPLLVKELLARGKAALGGPPRIHLSLSSFIPKPHTPFQWAGMESPARLLEKQRTVREALRRDRSVEIKTQDVRVSVLEGIFSRGDRRLGPVLEEAWRAGARFDSWNEHFKPEIWERALERCGIDAQAFLGPLDPDAALPWEHIATGMSRTFLRAERGRALRAEPTPACTERSCETCRGCDFASTFVRETPLEALPGPSVGPAAASEPAIKTPVSGGRPAAFFRYGVVYEKTGRFRYLGHNDLVNALQRVFRRAGIEVLYSEGFHPKPLMSFGPALPLGMVGRAEFFEFRSGKALDAAALPAQANSVSPAGLRFLRCLEVPGGAPSWMERLCEAVYSLDLKAAGREDRPDIAALFEDPAVRESAPWLLGADLEPGGERLRLRVSISAQKIPRPQDLAARVLGLEKAVFAMTRESFLLDGGTRLLD
jgi:radical SAM family uncharacterized protein/radical SAM-linked protein